MTSTARSTSRSPAAPVVLPEVGTLRFLDWLALGWRDLRRCPAVALAHGAVLAAFGAAIFGFAPHRFWLLAGAFSGFLLVAPVLATGLYAVSRALEQGAPPGFSTVRAVWQSGDSRMIRFGMLLALAGTGWVLTSAAMITLWAPQPINEPADFLRHVVIADSWLFEAWLAMGGLLAAPVFASSVIAMPMLLDRQCGVLDAVLTSWRVVMVNPLPMAAWGAVIMMLTAAGMATALLGLIVLMPLLGHASWHAYRDLVRDAA
ncbi:MAG: DUF2189 domain-containing protein [Burkholderiales bacterium]|nr:DUF2189 domain-containing protein [Burkholderiales bacterium]